MKLKRFLFSAFYGAYSVAVFSQHLIEQSLMIPMKDGVELATDMYLPDSTGTFPVVLVRTPYGKNQMKIFAEEFAKYGYASVFQDVRGKYGSDGVFIPFKYEAEDGRATMEWLSDQKWCDQIMLFGSSYLGYCALTVTQFDFPKLKAVFSYSGWLNGEQIMQPGGAEHLMLMLPWILEEEQEAQGIQLNFDAEELFSYLPLIGVAKHAGLDNSTWGKPTFEIEDFPYEENVIPIFHLTGWYDFVLPAVFNEFTSFGRGKAPQVLVAGPWIHNQAYTGISSIGEVEYETGFTFNRLIELSADWFDKWSSSSPQMREDSVSVYLMNQDRWLYSESWPIKKSVETLELYLNSSGNAGSIQSEGGLSKKLKSDAFSDSFVFDPNDPVPTTGGANFFVFQEITGITDQADLELREDVLTYITPPLEAPITILGESQVELYISSEGTDTDFTAKLTDVTPDGKALIITEGIVRVSSQSGAINSQEIYKLLISVGPSAYQLKTGHRLRLEISSSNFPKYTRNPNTGESAMLAKELLAVKQIIFHSVRYPSKIKLPILKKKP